MMEKLNFYSSNYSSFYMILLKSLSCADCKKHFLFFSMLKTVVLLNIFLENVMNCFSEFFDEYNYLLSIILN